MVKEKRVLQKSLVVVVKMIKRYRCGVNPKQMYFNINHICNTTLKFLLFIRNYENSLFTVGGLSLSTIISSITMCCCKGLIEMNDYRNGEINCCPSLLARKLKMDCSLSACSLGPVLEILWTYNRYRQHSYLRRKCKMQEKIARHKERENE